MSRTIPCYAMRGALKAALLALAVALVLAPMFGCAGIELADGCSTDRECMAQCLEELRPDEDPEVCEISLAPYLKERSALLAD